MLHITNPRTIAIGVSALSLAAAGISVAVLDNGSTAGPASAGAAAGTHRTATAAAATSDLGARRTVRTMLDNTAVTASFAGPAAASRSTDRPTPRTATLKPTRITQSTPVTTQAPKRSSLASVDVGGPVNAHVDTGQLVDDVTSTVHTTLRRTSETVHWATATVDRTVRSLPVTASVRSSKSGTDVTVSALGVGAQAHVG